MARADDLSLTIVKALEEARLTGPVSVGLEFEGKLWPPLDEVNGAMATSYAFVLLHLPEEKLP